MKQEIISLSELPVLTPNIKRAICMLAWSLYQVEDTEDISAKYLLRTRSEKFLLSTDGSIIRKMHKDENLVIKSQVYFSGFYFSSFKSDE